MPNMCKKRNRFMDIGPEVICTVWMEQKALKHTNTCMGQTAVEAYEMMQ